MTTTYPKNGGGNAMDDNANLFCLHARCRRSELAIEMNGGPPELHAVFALMKYRECEAKMAECMAALERPDEWQFTIEPEDNEGCRA